MDHEYFTKPIESHAKKNNRAPFLVSSENQTLFYSDVLDFARELKKTFVGLDVGNSSPILVHLPRSVEQALLVASLLYLGYPTLLLPSETKWHDFERLFKKYPFSAVMSLPGFANRIESENLIEPPIPFVRHDLNCLQTKISILKMPSQLEDPILEASWFLMTSGSTGVPKIVVLDQKNLIERTQGEIDLFCIEESDSLLNVLPFHHDLGLNQLMTALVTGSSFELVNNWLPVDLARKITATKKLAVTGMPSIWESLLKIFTHESSRVEAEGYLTVSGGSLNPQNLLQLQKAFPRARILKTYGQTETFRTFAQTDQDSILEENCGSPIRGVEILLLNESQQPCAPGEVGQLVHFGSGTMQGYWLSPLETESKMTRWKNWHPDQVDRRGVLTGDYFKIVDSNRFKFMGRRDDLVKVNGHRFHTGEVEHCLRSYEAVADACVLCVDGDEIGLLDKRLIAFVVPKFEQEVHAEEILNYCAKQLASFKVPQEIFFRKQLPLTSNFKVDRMALLKSIEGN